MAGMISAKVDKDSQKELMESIKALHLLGDKPLAQIMREQGRLFAVDVATWTAKQGNTKASGESHQRAIVWSIKRTYKSVNKVSGAVAKKAGRGAAARFNKFIEENNLVSAQRMIDSMGLKVSESPWNGRPIKLMKFDKGAEHYRRRKSKNTKPPAINYVVIPYKKVETFAKKESFKAGELKSGWAEAAKQLGGVNNPTKGIPGYAKKKRHKTKGRGVVTGSTGKKFVSVSNLSPYANNSTVDSAKALALRVKNQIKVTERIILRSARAVTKAQRSRNRDLGIAAKTVKNALKMI